MSALSAAALLGAGLAIAGPPTVATAGRLITGGEVKNGSLTGKDIRNGSVTAADLAPSARKGKVGPQGPKGDPGPAGGGSGSATEIVEWSYSYEADGRKDVVASTTEQIPAGTLVRVIKQEVTYDGPHPGCNTYSTLGDRPLYSYDERVSLEPGAVSMRTYCGFDFEPANPVPSFEFSITLALTTVGLEPERTLQ